MVYCTAKTNSLDCVPAIATPSGAPRLSSLGSFDVTASNVLNFRNGLFFYGTQGRASLPFLGGTLCVAPPLRRTDIQNAGGSLPQVEDCSGSFTFDVNGWLDTHTDPFLVVGATLHGQFWSRDPGDPLGAGLTDAVELVICP